MDCNKATSYSSFLCKYEEKDFNHNILPWLIRSVYALLLTGNPEDASDIVQDIIHQIRPVSQAEKESGSCYDADIIVNIARPPKRLNR